MINITDPAKCSGCHACASTCPKNCISMEADQNGFLYPKINESDCVNCEICEKACHHLTPIDKHPVDAVYAALNNAEAIRAASSSGGVFYALAKATIDNGGVVFGAAFDENFNVVHKCIDKLQDISLLQGSKYVQSTIGNSYVEAKAHLSSGKQVLFTGTPCQINGLLAFLGNAPSNLLTMDFICHGVPSPLVWRKYLDEMICKYNSPVKSVSFRSKVNGWKNYSMQIVFENGEIYTSRASEDPFLRSFIMDIHLRESCSSCQAKGCDRAADITVADFWGISKTLPEMDDNKGTSAIIARGQKALDSVNRVSDSLTLSQCDIDDILKNNPSIVKSVSKNPLRDNFFKLIRKRGFFKAYHSYCDLSLIAKLHRKLGF